MDRITQVVPTPKTVTLGGRGFPVWEARLSDLASLQAWVDSRFSDPLADVWDRARDPDLSDAERDRVLYDALDAAGDGPPEYSRGGGRADLDTAEGVGVFLAVALSRGSPGLTAGDVADVMAEMTPAEYAALRRAFFGIDSLREISRLLTDGLPTQPPGPPLAWGEAIDELARSHRWTYAYIYSLTLSEFRNARRHGEPEKAGVVVGAENLATARRLQHLRYCRAYGLEPDPLIAGGGDEGSPPEGTP